MTATDVRSFVLAQLGVEDDHLPPDVDLLSEGLVDSFGFLQLILALEERLGTELDLEELDTVDLTRLGPLCAFVAEQAAA
jgi:acyl carrier protein